MPGARGPKTQALEAVLLVAGEPLSSRKLSQYANLADGTEALTLIRQLNRLYDQEGRAFRVEQVAGGFQLLTRPALADWLRRLASAPPEVRLSIPAMETLAVVAYRQPVLRAEIEAIRGVACGEILRQLMDRELVRISGRSEELGRPYVYGTTDRFLQVFGLADLADLPRAEALRGALPAGAAAAGEDIRGRAGEHAAGTPHRSDLHDSSGAVAQFEDEDEEEIDGEEYEEDDFDDDYEEEEYDDDFDDEEWDDEEELDEEELDEEELDDEELDEEDEDWQEVEDDEVEDDEFEDEDEDEDWEEEDEDWDEEEDDLEEEDD